MKKKQKIPAYIKFDDDLFKTLSLFCGDDDNKVQMPRLFIALWHYLTTGDANKAIKEHHLSFKEIMFFKLAIKKVVRGG